MDYEYYIQRNIIPPLERLFRLMGVNVRTWYDEMPKIGPHPYGYAPRQQGGSTIVKLVSANLSELPKCTTCSSAADDAGKQRMLLTGFSLTLKVYAIFV